jgi:hypothetical protein
MEKKNKVWPRTVSDKLDHAINLSRQGSLGEEQGCVGTGNDALGPETNGRTAVRKENERTTL